MLPRLRFLAFAFLLLGATPRAEARSGPVPGTEFSPTLSASAHCDAGQVTVQWTSYEKGADVLPAWTGYDVLRRASAGCEAFVRLNATPFPRVPGVQHGHTLVDTPPDLETTYEYRVVRVDAGGAVVACTVNEGYCFGSSQSDWVSCPDLAAPAVKGKVVLVGPFYFVERCAESCYPTVYLEDAYGTLYQDLQPHIGSTLAFYGDVYCGTVEGCGMAVTRFEPATCGTIVPVRAPSWAALKILYR